MTSVVIINVSQPSPIITILCVVMSGITVRGYRSNATKKWRVESSWFTDGLTVYTILITGYKLEDTGVFFPCKFIIRDRYDGNVFNSVRAKWRSGTARLVVSGFRTRKTCAASSPKSSLHGGADATAARGWRACSAEARSHEWTFLFTTGAAWYCRIVVIILI